jgi:hypothetical protein
MGFSPFQSVNRQELYTKYECISKLNHDGGESVKITFGSPAQIAGE